MLQEGAAAEAPAASVPRGLPALPAIPALGLYELPQIELPRNWLDIFAPLPAPKPAAPANAPEPVAPIQYDQLPALPARNRRLLQMPGYNPQGQQARSLAPWRGAAPQGQRLRAVQQCRRFLRVFHLSGESNLQQREHERLAARQLI